MGEEDIASFHYSYRGPDSRGVRGMLLDAEARRRGARRGEYTLGRKGQASADVGKGHRRRARGGSGEESGRAATRPILLLNGELLFQRGDEFMQRFAVRGLPLDEDEEAVLVEEYRVGGRLPALRHIQRHGGRGQLVEARVELAGAFVRGRANAFNAGRRHGAGRRRRREIARE